MQSAAVITAVAKERPVTPNLGASDASGCIAARPPTTTHRVDCTRLAPRGSARVYRSSWWRHRRVRGVPARCEYHSHFPADGWQTSAAGYDNRPILPALLAARPSSRLVADHFHAHDGDGWRRYAGRLPAGCSGRQTASPIPELPAGTFVPRHAAEKRPHIPVGDLSSGSAQRFRGAAATPGLGAAAAARRDPFAPSRSAPRSDERQNRYPSPVPVCTP